MYFLKIFFLIGRYGGVCWGVLEILGCWGVWGGGGFFGDVL